MRERREAVSSISDNDNIEYDEYNEPRYCEYCESLGFPFQKMGARLYRDEEMINGQFPSDWKNWLMCYRCHNVIPKIHGKYANSDIIGIKEVPDSPYNENNKPLFLPTQEDSISRRKIKYNKINRSSKSSARGESTDSDVIAAKKKGYKVSNIVEYNRY